MLRTDDTDRVRVLTLDRPEALNAFNQALYHAVAAAIEDAGTDDDVSVVVVTGEGRAFSAGNDLLEMAAQNEGADLGPEGHGFPRLLDALRDFPKPFICAVNGLALGIGATILGYADLAFMSTEGRIKCPFSSLGVAPEAASSYTFPTMIGRQQAAWVLMSSKWFSAEECLEMGLVLSVHAPDELMPAAMDHARELARLPLSSLVETKALIVAPHRDAIIAARAAEDAAFSRLLGGPANREALMAFAEKRDPDFTNLD